VAAAVPCVGDQSRYKKKKGKKEGTPQAITGKEQASQYRFLERDYKNAEKRIASRKREDKSGRVSRPRGRKRAKCSGRRAYLGKINEKRDNPILLYRWRKSTDLPQKGKGREGENPTRSLLKGKLREGRRTRN